MTIYTIENKLTAEQLRQLFRLNAECVGLHWSQSITDVPEDVIEALEIIESFIEEYVIEQCDFFGELSESDEDAIIDLIRSIPDLRESLGTGVITAGSQADKVKSLTSPHDGTSDILTALETGKNVILF